MAMMRTTTPGSLTGSLSASGTMSAKVTVGTVNAAAVDMSNYYNKQKVDELLLGKADVDHDHIIKNGVFELSLQEAYDHLLKQKITEMQANQLIYNYAAPIEHTHEELASKAYVDEVLGNIESELDEIIGDEEV